MSKSNQRPLLSALAFAAVFNFHSALAELPPPPLKIGAGLEQVAATWGAPKEKFERETRREERWVYERGEVNFRDGKVLNWRFGERRYSETEPDQSIADSARHQQAGAPAKKQDLSKVITELIDELPVDDGSPAGPGTGTGLMPPPAQ